MTKQKDRLLFLQADPQLDLGAKMGPRSPKNQSV